MRIWAFFIVIILALILTFPFVPGQIATTTESEYLVQPKEQEFKSEILIEAPTGDRAVNDQNNNKLHDSLEPAPESKKGLYIQYRRKTTYQDVSALEELGVEVVYRCKYINMIETKIVPKEILLVIANLPGVIFVEPTVEFKPLLDISARALKARESNEYSPNTAWELGATGKGVNIAIFDSGVDDNHPSFENKFIAGVDFSNTGGTITPKDGSFNPDDNDGHGTSVAGIALGTGGQDERYKGIAPDAGLVEVKVTSRLGGRFAEAMEWCIDNKNTDWNNDNIDENDGIDVLGVSLGLAEDNSDGSDSMAQLVNRVAEAGIVVVVAAGNSGPDNEGFNAIAAADKVITVGNLNTQGTILRNDDVIDSTSNTGPRLDDGDTDQYDEMKPEVVAPGTNVMAPTFSPIGQGNINNGYNTFGGTSAACPHIAGLCALLLEASPALRPIDIKNILRDSAEAIGNPTMPGVSMKYNYSYGFGSVDAYEAVKMAQSYTPVNHAPTIQSISASSKYVAPTDRVNITTLAHDPDDDPLTYEYQATGGELTGTGPEVTWTAPEELGEYIITVIVDDGEFKTDPKSTTITVEDSPGNHAPVIERVDVNPPELEPGENTTITVTATDPDDHELFYEYSPTAGKIIGTGEKVVWVAPETAGNYKILITVSDFELSAETKITIPVTADPDNKPPEIESIIANPNRIEAGGRIWLSVRAIDPENGKLVYTYSASSGKISGTGSNVNWTAPEKPGKYSIRVTVSDNGGLTDSKDISLDVYLPNHAPQIVDERVFPAIIKNDGKDEILITVRMEDKNGLEDISKVEIDLTQVFGSEHQKMYDNGKFGDQNKYDGVYSISYLIPKGLVPGRKVLHVSAQDFAGEIVTDDVYINITSASKEESDDGILSEYLPVPGFESSIMLVAFISILILFVSTRSRFNVRKRT
jgi:subtilisin family serine protease